MRSLRRAFTLEATIAVAADLSARARVLPLGVSGAVAARAGERPCSACRGLPFEPGGGGSQLLEGLLLSKACQRRGGLLSAGARSRPSVSG